MQGINIVGVQFRRAGKIYDFSAGDIPCQVGDQVVVDSERGPSLAFVCQVKFDLYDESYGRKLKPILRKATTKEISLPLKITEKEVHDFTKEKIETLGLDMRILKCEIQFGGSKIIIYFNAPGRVDFRELVKELAGGLKARVELKQVGSRDETKLLGGIGICGREYCCSSFLREFVPVSIRMAKNQNLALNPSKVSGGCGRLLCCLTYENETYKHLRMALPPRGAKVKVIETAQIGIVQKTDLLNQTALIELADQQIQSFKITALEIQAGYENPKQEDLDEGFDEWAEDLDLKALEESARLNHQSALTHKKQDHQRGKTKESKEFSAQDQRSHYKHKNNKPPQKR